jgi:hypothetical protein
MVGIDLSSSEDLTKLVSGPDLSFVTARDLINIIRFRVSFDRLPFESERSIEVRRASLHVVESASHSDGSVESDSKDVSVGTHSDASSWHVTHWLPSGTHKVGGSDSFSEEGLTSVISRDSASVESSVDLDESLRNDKGPTVLSIVNNFFNRDVSGI